MVLASSGRTFDRGRLMGNGNGEEKTNDVCITGSTVE